MKALHGQSLLDLAIQHTGAVENVLALALANGLSITDDLEAGTELQSNSTDWTINKDIHEYYSVKKITPATDITNITTICSGIGCWDIETDFIIY